MRSYTKVRIVATGETGYYRDEIQNGLVYPFKYKIIVNNEIRWLEQKEFRALSDIRKKGK